MKKLTLPVLLLLVLTLLALKEYKTSEIRSSTNGVASLETVKGLAVLELFTSQGCSSCPPADAVLEQLQKANPQTVLALSYHVDYWNYIGWEDPFSASEYTDRQRDYNIKFKSRSNYTPQLVINGREHLVGSHKAKIVDRIAIYKEIAPLNVVRISGKKQDRKVVFQYDIGGSLVGKNLRIVVVLNERTTEVKRGENQQRKLRNTNVVVGERIIRASNGKGEGFIEIPPIVTDTDEASLFVLVQDTDLEITGGAKLAL